MNPIDPLRPSSIDGLVGRTEPGLAGPASSYTPYHWEQPWVPTPQPIAPRFNEPRFEAPRLPRYEDSLMTQKLFDKLMRDQRG